MRQFHIDFTGTENTLPDGNILGNQGEHNATELIITPPQEMTDNENITSYRIAFELCNCRAVHSEIIEKSETLSLPLFSQITSSDTVAVQLEGYDNNGELVIKSEKITKLKFNPSVYGVEIPPNGSPNSMAAEVAANTNFRKSFNYRTITLDQSMCFGINNGTSAILCLYEEVIPVNTEIKTIRLNYNGQMIDIKDMATIDDIPYILNMNRVYLSQSHGMLTLAVIGFVTDTNAVISTLQNYEIPEIEVDYYI